MTGANDEAVGHARARADSREEREILGSGADDVRIHRSGRPQGLMADHLGACGAGCGLPIGCDPIALLPVGIQRIREAAGLRDERPLRQPRHQGW